MVILQGLCYGTKINMSWCGIIVVKVRLGFRTKPTWIL